jgi:hypothetical protein
MTEQEYQDLLTKAEALLQAIRDFPAHELNAYAEAHHLEHKSFTLTMWSVWCEAS